MKPRARAALFALSTLTALALTNKTARGAPTSGPAKKCINAAETGQHLRASGKLLDAKKELAACTAVECPAVIRRDCAKWVEELDGAIPTVVVRVTDDAGKEVLDGKVSVDDNPFVDRLDGRALPIDPGRHHFVWTGPGANDRIEDDVVVREGERSRAVTLRAPAKPTPPPPPPSSKGSSLTPLVLALGGAGVLATGVGGVFWGLGASARSDLANTCAPQHSCSQDSVDRARTKLIVGDVFVGVGILAFAGAVYFFVRGDSEPEKAIEKTTAIRF